MSSSTGERASSLGRILLILLLALLFTLIFFRSVLPRVPRLFLRGRLRINRIGIRGIRGIEWRSRGFSTSSCNARPESGSTASRKDQLHIKVQRIHAVLRRPKWSNYSYNHSAEEGSIRSRSLLTIHVQGVGIRVSRPEQYEATLKDRLEKLQEKERQAEEQEEKEQKEQDERLEKLMQSPFMSPLQGPQSFPLDAAVEQQTHGGPSYTPLERSSMHKASVMSLHTVLRSGAWLRYTAIPAVRSAILRLVRAAVYVITSSLPSLTSLVDVQIHRIEVYAQEADAVVRIGRAGLEFSMAVVAFNKQVAKGSGTAMAQNTVVDLSPPMWRDVLKTASQMPTRIGSGAKGAASYLVGGLPTGQACVRLRVEGVQVFEAGFSTDDEDRHTARPRQSSRTANISKLGLSHLEADPSTPTSPLSGQQQKQWRRRTSAFRRPDSSSGLEMSPDLGALPEELSFEWPEVRVASPRSMSPEPSLKRSNSASMLGAMSSITLSGFTDRWADWALEPLTDSDFSSDTGWATKKQALGKGGGSGQRSVQIPKSARLLSLSGVSEIGLGLHLSSSLSIKAKEMVDINISMCEMEVGLDAVLRVMSILEERKARRTGPTPSVDGVDGKKRSVISKHLAQQEKAAPMAVLRMLSAFSFAIPAIRLGFAPRAKLPDRMRSNVDESIRTRLPPPLLMEVLLMGFHFEIGTSSPSDQMHQRYLGACGVKDHKLLKHQGARKGQPPSGQPGSSARPATVRQKRRELIEHRRAFAVDLGLASLKVHCGLDGERPEKRSELLFVGDLSMQSKSTWTIFGIFTSSTSPDNGPRMYFQGDHNEEVMVLQAAIGHIKGDLKLDHLTALLSGASFFKAQRTAVKTRLGISDAPRLPTELERLIRVPKIIAGIELSGIAYTLDASTHEQQQVMAHEARKLVLSVPHVSATFSGDYHDEYVKRPDAEKRAAYKLLKKDELEWSLQGYTPSKSLRETFFSGRSKVTEEPGELAEAGSGGEAPQGKSKPQDSRYSEEGMTIEETLKRMNELQDLETKGKIAPRRPAPLTKRSTIRDIMSKTGKVRVRRYSRKSPMAAETLYSVRYQFETNVQVEAIEAYLSLSGDRTSSRRGFYRSMSGVEAPSVGSSQHHLLALHTFELAGSGDVPGNVEKANRPGGDPEVPSLCASDAVVDFRGSVEDIDVELWHPAALQAYVFVAESIARAKMPFDPALFDNVQRKEQSSQRSLGAEQNLEHAREEVGEPGAWLDHLPSGLTLYMSIGSAIAHLGGTDTRSDPNLTRGIGLEAKRMVLEYSAVSESKNHTSTTKLGWGARSALELPEDLCLQALALATRHGKAALARVTLFELGLFPILDAAQATQQHMEGTAEESFAQAKNAARHGWPGLEREDEAKSEIDAESSDEQAPSALYAPAVWGFHRRKGQGLYEAKRRRPHFRQQDRSNFIFWMPFAAFKATIRPPSSVKGTNERAVDEITIRAEDAKLLAFKVDLLHAYCILLTVANLKRLVPKKPKPSAGAWTGESVAASKRFKPKPTFAVQIDISEVHVSITLPHDVNLFIRARRVEARKNIVDGLSVTFESIMGAVESPKQGTTDLWEEAIRLRDWKIIMPIPKEGEGRRIEINGEGALIKIPFGYQVNQIIENASVAFKATKQLVYQFLTGKDDSIIVLYSEEPKQLPGIKLNLRILTIEAQDDPMETRLNIIWRAGGDENRAREERETAFQEKVAEVLAEERNRSMASFTESEYSFSAATSDEDSSYSRPAKPKVSIEEARAALDAFNSSSWICRYKNARAEQARREDAVLRRISGRYPIHTNSDELPILMATMSRTAPLFRSSMFRISLEVSQPTSFGKDKVRDFIHEHGDGIPKDTAFSLLVPMHMRWRMSEWSISLRDYPMPLLHVPPPSQKQPDNLKSWEFEGDFCIAEQLGGPESIRQVPAVVVPAATGHPDAVEYGIMVPKVTMPVKFYGDPTIKIHSSHPIRIVWGQSIQPTIQDIMRVIDGITSPPHDPSPRIGFWDKVPLVVHGKLQIKFVGEGDFNLHLKGSRDPYQITGQAAGWVKCWRGGVQINVGHPNDDGEVFQILSHEYVMAIPDLRDYIDKAAIGITSGRDEKSKGSGEEHGPSSHDPSLASSTSWRYMKDPTFDKVVIKLTNGVKWGSGMYLERTCDDETCERSPKCHGEPFYRECRSFKRIPHWKVITKTRQHFDSLPPSERRDSYRGWRSHHIHFSLSVYSPEAGLPGFCSDQPKKNVANNFYFTPLVWAHFWAWMRLFNGAMGLPVRHGNLFPDSPAPSPKFGRHLGTIKYRFDLAPLFICHQYRQFSKADWARGLKTYLGVKARLALFRLDMHQRQQETIQERPELGGPQIVLYKPFYEAVVDCAHIDLRTLAGQFNEPSQKLVNHGEAEEDDEPDLDDMFAGDCTIPDRDLEWVDMEDFNELTNTALADPLPKLKLLPVLVCHHFSYYKKKGSEKEGKAREKREREGTGRKSHPSRPRSVRSGKPPQDLDTEALLASIEHSKFGNEPSHTCLIDKAPEPVLVRRDFAVERLEYIRGEIDRLLSGSSDLTGEHRAAQLCDLRNRERPLLETISYMDRLGEQVGKLATPHRSKSNVQTPYLPDGNNYNALEIPSMYRDMESFDNRFIAHSPTIFFSNATRGVLLKYYYSSRLRRGYCHHMTATAVRYIRELAKKGKASQDDSDNEEEVYSPDHEEDQCHKKKHGGNDRRRHGWSRDAKSPEAEEEASSMLCELLEDTLRYIETDTKEGGRGSPQRFDGNDNPRDGISDEFVVKKSNICVFLTPQIVLKSEVDERSTVIITALRARLQNYTVTDDTCAEDSVNAVVLRRNFFALDSMQAFHPSRHCQFLAKASEKYGFVYVPLETMLDFRYQFNDFDRIVPRTDAIMHYDKFNKLRISDSSQSVAALDENGEPKYDHLYHRMDVIRMNCPRVSISANSNHYGALYNVVTDLILYRDPAYRDHAKQLEEIMFAYDFADVSGLADVVTAYQVRIRDATELADQYQMNLDKLNETGRLDYLSINGELYDLVRELHLMMEAITTAQESKGGADREKKSALRFDTYTHDVAWNMMGDEDGQLLAKLSVKGIGFTWLNKADNSAANTISIVDLQVLNVAPDALFAEIITKYHKAQNHPMAKSGRFLDVMWSVLPPVGGISIIDQCELHLHPVRIQIEILVGKEIMDYIFGSKRQREKQETEQKQIEKEERQQAARKSKKSPFARLMFGSRKANQNGGSVMSSRNASNSDLSSSHRPSFDSNRDDEEHNGEEDDDDVKSQRSLGRKQPSKTLASKTVGKESPWSRPGTPASRTPLDSDEDSASHTAQHAIMHLNATEMRSRANAFRTFVYVSVAETIFSLSYKGEKEKSITDLYDLVFRTPTFEYRNLTFGYVDLADRFKKDVFKAAWGQKTTLLKEILTHRPHRKRTAIGNLKSIRQASKGHEAESPPMTASPVEADSVSETEIPHPSINIVTSPVEEEDNEEPLSRMALAVPSPSRESGSPSFKLGKFLSCNFRSRSGSGSGSSMTVPRNDGSMSSSSSAGSTPFAEAEPRISAEEGDGTVRARRSFFEIPFGTVKSTRSSHDI